MKNNSVAIKASRDDAYFSLYYQLPAMGIDRSLNNLYELVHKMGIKISFKTLGRYSAKYEWQRRVIEIDARMELERVSNLETKVKQLNERQAQTGRALQSIAEWALKPFQEAMQSKRPLELSVSDILKLYEVGTKSERLALGQPIERKELTINLWTNFAVQVSHIFKAVLAKIDIADDKKAELVMQFGERFDALGDQYIEVGGKDYLNHA